MDKDVKEYLLDTNILIYYFADAIPSKEINKTEFLAWEKHTGEGFEKAKEFIGPASAITLNNEIADLTIDVRRKYKIKLPDAVIAATAWHNNLILVTRNDKDFEDVKELEIYNPFQD